MFNKCFFFFPLHFDKQLFSRDRKVTKMFLVAAARAINLRRVVYITITPGSVLIHMDTGEKIPVPGPFTANVDFEEEFQKAQIAVIVYSTNNGSKTLIGAAYILEIVHSDGVSTYKMFGGATLQIKGGGDFAAHLKTVKEAEEAVRRSPDEFLGYTKVDSIKSEYQHQEYIDSKMIPNYKCTVCGKEGSMRCNACYKVAYCGEEHQSYHWEQGHWRDCDDF
jgi:hypothetical protein